MVADTYTNVYKTTGNKRIIETWHGKIEQEQFAVFWQNINPYAEITKEPYDYVWKTIQTFKPWQCQKCGHTIGLLGRYLEYLGKIIHHCLGR